MNRPPHRSAHPHLAPVPWGGRETLVIGLDIGTTQSAASIVHLYPGQVPKFRVVSRYPDAPNASKIPSLGVYNGQGVGIAFGAEALAEEYAEDLADGKLWLAKQFKLHLHPPALARPLTEHGGANGGFVLPPLPPGVSVQQCYKDLIQYVYKQARVWFVDNTPDGQLVWSKLGHATEVVLAFPNGWGLVEQSVLTAAVAEAGIVGDLTRERRLHLVTEAEASVHFGLLYSEDQIDGWMVPGNSFVVVDAGGSTVDSCTYTIASVLPKLKLREAKLSDCAQAGGIYVSQAFEQVVRRKLGTSTFNTPEFVATMVASFDAKTKLLFSNADENQIVKFGFDRDTDRAVGISRGRLTLSGAEVEAAFIPTVDLVVKSINDQIRDVPVTHILLVGGYGESPYLQRRIREAFEKGPRQIRVVTVDEPSRKAVSLGAVVYYTKDSVVARATRFEFGLSTNRPYEPSIAAGRQVITLSSGKQFLPGGWTPIVPRGKVIQFNEPLRESFWVHKRPGDSLTFSTTIVSFDGPNARAAYNGFSRDPEGNLYPGFQECCLVAGDLTPLAIATKVSKTPDGGKYRELDFQIGLFFGDVTLRACLIWKDEKGKEVRGPASIIPAAFV